MRRLLTKLTIPVLFAAACGSPGSEQGARVEGARITLPAVAGRPGAAYFTITASEQPTRITGVTSPRVKRIELHESMAAGMGPLRDTALPAGKQVVFEPGGRHAMLFGVDSALKVGDRAPLTVALEGLPAVTVDAQVQGPGGGGDAH